MLKLQFADIVISLTPANGREGLKVSYPYVPFLSECQPDVIIYIHEGANRQSIVYMPEY